MLVVTVWIFWF